VNKETIVLSNKMIELSSFRNYKEATFLISVIGEPNLNGVIIEKDTADLYAPTLKDMPCVAYLKSKESDLGGHELRVTKNKDGTKAYSFATSAIGTYFDVWVENREVDGFEDKKDVILAKVKLWSSRFPNYIKVVEKLFNKGKLSSSWEIDVLESEQTDSGKVLKEWEFMGNCLLGSNIQGAVPQAGMLEIASVSDDELELAEALTQDILNNEQEGTEQQSQDIPVVDTSSNEVDINIYLIKEQGGKEEMSEIIKDKSKEVASVSINDLYSKVQSAINSTNKDSYIYLARIYPYEFRAVGYTWYRDNEDSYISYSYSLNSDDTVSILSQKDVKMSFVDTTEIETMVAEKDAKDAEIASLTTTLSEKEAELSSKVESITKLGADIASKEAEIAELIPFKEKVEASELAEKEAELAQKKEDLKAYATKSGFLTVEDLETPEIAEMIENLDEKSIKVLIAEKILAKLEISEAEKIAQELALAEKAKETTTKEVDVAEVKTPKTNINTSTKDDIASPLSIMDKFLNK